MSEITFRKVAAIILTLFALPSLIVSIPRILEPVMAGFLLFVAYQIWNKEL